MKRLARPAIIVLAGVNGAGKSSAGGDILRAKKVPWFNPDAFARALIEREGLSRDEADAAAWAQSRARLEQAIETRASFAFETTLGGSTIAGLLRQAARTHDVMMIYCGLASVEMHLERIRLRVQHGGHDIPEGRVRARWQSSREHLVALLPHFAHLQIFDNSTAAAAGEDIPALRLVMDMKDGKVLEPRRDDPTALEAVPDWARPIVQAAFRHEDAMTRRGRRKK